nr:MAG TPA: hypothetical protein [Caudoviricetes sp.]
MYSTSRIRCSSSVSVARAFFVSRTSDSAMRRLSERRSIRQMLLFMRSSYDVPPPCTGAVPVDALLMDVMRSRSMSISSGMDNIAASFFRRLKRSALHFIFQSSFTFSPRHSMLNTLCRVFIYGWSVYISQPNSSLIASLTIQTLRLPLPTLSRMFATSADSLFTSSCVGLKQDIHAQTKIVMAMDTALCMDTSFVLRLDLLLIACGLLFLDNMLGEFGAAQLPGAIVLAVQAKARRYFQKHVMFPAVHSHRLSFLRSCKSPYLQRPAIHLRHTRTNHVFLILAMCLCACSLCTAQQRPSPALALRFCRRRLLRKQTPGLFRRARSWKRSPCSCHARSSLPLFFLSPYAQKKSSFVMLRSAPWKLRSASHMPSLRESSLNFCQCTHFLQRITGSYPSCTAMRLNWLRVGRSTVGSPATSLRNASLNPSERIVALQTTCIKWSASISRIVFSSFVFGDKHIEIAQSPPRDKIIFVQIVAE